MSVLNLRTQPRLYGGEPAVLVAVLFIKSKGQRGPQLSFVTCHIRDVTFKGNQVLPPPRCGRHPEPSPLSPRHAAPFTYFYVPTALLVCLGFKTVNTLVGARKSRRSQLSVRRLPGTSSCPNSPSPLAF